MPDTKRGQTGQGQGQSGQQKRDTPADQNKGRKQQDRQPDQNQRDDDDR